METGTVNPGHVAELFPAHHLRPADWAHFVRECVCVCVGVCGCVCVCGGGGFVSGWCVVFVVCSLSCSVSVLRCVGVCSVCVFFCVCVCVYGCVRLCVCVCMRVRACMCV